MQKTSYARHRFPREVIQHAVWLYFRFPLSFRDVEDLLAQRGVDVSYETVRRWALKFLKRAMKRYGRPATIVTDRLRAYGAAMKVLGIVERQDCGRWLNNRAENSHQPFRRREGAMAKFRDAKTLQKFAAVHASIHNHFNQDRHLNRRDIFKQNRAAALAEWRQLAA